MTHCTRTIELLESRIAPAIVYGITDTFQLVSFHSDAPGTILESHEVTNAAGDLIVGTDFRPADGQLYGLGFNYFRPGSECQLYTLDPHSGMATTVGSRFAIPQTSGGLLGPSTYFGFDFDPVADQVRVVTSSLVNFRIDPTAGALADTDTAFSTATSLVGAAYSNNFVGAPGSTLFAVDFPTGTLVRVGNEGDAASADNGTLTTVGFLGVNLRGLAGFDIEQLPDGTQTALATFTLLDSGTALYSVNLTTGEAAKLGDIGSTQTTLRAMAIAPEDNGLTIAGNGRSATYRDADGDLVTVKLSAGALASGNFRFATTAFGTQLAMLDLANDSSFAKANITFTAKPQAGKGDGTVHVGRIDAGDGTTSTPGVAALTVGSMGVVGTSQTSTIIGKLGRLTVKTDFSRTLIQVTGGSDGSIGSISISGSVIGTGSGVVSGIHTTGAIGAISIGGSFYGGQAPSTGSIIAGAGLGSVTVKGSLFGGSGAESGSIEASGNIGPVKIVGNLTGGSGAYSGSIHTSNAGSVSSLTIGGSVTGQNAFNGVVIGGHLGATKIGGDLTGNAPGDVRITAAGTSDSAVPAIKSLAIRGSVENANILAGYDAGALVSINPDASIGAVTVGSSWIASNLIAGAAAGGDDRFGTDDDVKITEAVADPIFAKIASLTIKGTVLGSFGGTDHYGVVAEEIGKIKVGAATYTLAIGTNLTGLVLGPTPDFRVREV